MSDEDAFANYRAWKRWADTRDPKPDLPRVLRNEELDLADCELCGGTQWVQVPDPLFDGALVDQRCPACQDHSVRATRNCFEMNDGRKIGPP